MSCNDVVGQNDDLDTSRKLYGPEGSHTKLTPQCAGSIETSRNTFLDWCFVLRPDVASDLQLLTVAPPNVAAPQRHFMGSAIQVQVKRIWNDTWSHDYLHRLKGLSRGHSTLSLSSYHS